MKQTTLLSFSLAILSCLIPLTVKAQVTPDGTTSTDVTQDGDNFTIEAGDRVGDNLFHSFNEFSVPTGGSAGFNNADSIANIFSRVTGGDISNIDGMLSANGTANLFLINPNGIIFGSGARLDIGGSFYGSTADSLLFDGDTEFSAVNPQAPPLLEVSIPIGLSFRDNPGDIVNRSFAINSAGESVGLEISSGNNLVLVGGDIDFEAGEATARGGNIYLSGLGESGIVGLNEDGSLSFPEDLALANITLTNNGVIDVIGTGGGNITINARNLTLETGRFGASLIQAGIATNSTSVDAQAGDININVAENISLDDSRISNQVASESIGNSGDIIINTRFLELTNSGRIIASTFGQGNTGVVNVTATDDLNVDGENSNGLVSAIGSLVAPGAVGDAAGVTISTTSLNLTNGGRVDTSTFGQGNAGVVNVTATRDITVDGDNLDGLGSAISSLVALGGVGNAAGVTISTTNLNLTSGGQVNASTFSQGNAGVVNVTATRNITVNGESLDNAPSGIFSLVNLGAVGDGGGVTISTTNLNLTSGGQVNASTFSQGNAGVINVTAIGDITADGESMSGFPSGIFSLVNPGAVGDAEGITISTTNLNLTAGGIVNAATFGQGNASNITIDANESIFIDGSTATLFRSGISANALIENGNGGNVSVNTDNLTITNRGTIEATNFNDSREFFPPGTGEPGNINIEANSLNLSNDALISAATQSPVGDGANINIASEDITLDNNALISARAFEEADGGNLSIESGFVLAFPDGNSDIVARADRGNGGRISIDTEAIFGLEERLSEPANFTNDIDASSEFGLQGDFSLNTPDFDPTSGLIELPAAVGDATDQISQNPCQQGVGSQFIVTGKGGLPPNPTENLESDRITVGLVEPLPREGETERQGEERGEDIAAARVPAMGWVFNDKGEVTLTAYSNTDAERERSPQHHTTCQSNIAP